jgi:hypothetical protein
MGMDPHPFPGVQPSVYDQGSVPSPWLSVRPQVNISSVMSNLGMLLKNHLKSLVGVGALVSVILSVVVIPINPVVSHVVYADRLNAEVSVAPGHPGSLQ